MRFFNRFFLFLIGILFTIILAGCQDEDFGYTAQEIRTAAFRKNFEKEFGKIDADQNWDLSRAMPRTAKYEPWGHSEATRAIPGITSGVSTDIIKQVADDQWYSVQQETLDWMNNNLVEGRNNTVAGEPFSLLPPTLNDFALIPIYIGQHKMDWSLHLVTGGKDYKVWSEWEGSIGIQMKENESSDWRNVENNGNTLEAYAVQAKPILLNHTAITTDFFFYLSIDKGHMKNENGISGYDYADGNYAKTGTAQRSDEGMMLALNCPIPSNIGRTGELQNEVMIISCEDSNEAQSDYDMNDLVFLVVGYPDIPDLVEYTRKRYMCEDLGNTFDFDFNDVIVDVDQSIVKRAVLNKSATWVEFIEDQSSLKQYATVKHLCGTLPFRLQVGSTPFNTVSDPTSHQQTISELSGNSTRADESNSESSEGNGVNWNPEVKKEITGWNPTTNNIYLSVSNKTNPLEYVFTDKFGTKVEQQNDGDFIYIIDFPDAGKTPLIICVDQTVNWMEENVHIPESWWKTGEVFYKKVVLSCDPVGACSFTGDGSYPNGSKVVITARPNEGYIFDQWSDGNKDNTRTFDSVNENITLTAQLHRRSQVNVSWSYDGIEEANVTLSASINDEAQTSGTTYLEGTKIHFTATSTDPSKELASWKIGDAIISTKASFDYTVSNTYGEEVKLVAHFAAPWWDVEVSDGVIWSGSEQFNGYKQFNSISDYNGDNAPTYSETNGDYRPEYKRLIKSLKTGSRYILFEFESAINNGSMNIKNASWGDISNISGINKNYVLLTLTDEQAQSLINNNGMRVEFNLNGTLTAVKALSDAPDFMHAITVLATEGGTASSDKGSVDHGESVTLTATPATGKAFKGWKVSADDEDFASTANPWTINNVTTNLSYVAVFGDPALYSVSIANSITNGVISIKTDPDKDGKYYETTQVTIEATPDEGYVVDYWTKDGSKITGVTREEYKFYPDADAVYGVVFKVKPAGPTVLFEGEQATEGCQKIPIDNLDAFYEGATVKIYFTGSWLNVHYGQWNQQSEWSGTPRTKVLSSDDVSIIKEKGLWAHGDGQVTKVTIE